MKANNRRSLLPQPNSRVLDFSAQQPSIAESELQQSTRAAKRSSVHLSKLEGPLSRIGDAAASNGRPISRHTGGDQPQEIEVARPPSSSSNLHRRMSSARMTPAHAKSTSSSSNGSSTTQRSTTSQDVKQPTGTSRLVRSGTLTRQNGPPSVNTKLPTARQTGLQSASPVKSVLPKPTIPGRSGSIIAREDSTTSEILKAQTELMQLSLLHEQACAALASYEKSAQRQLGERHTYLREMLKEVIVLEQHRAKEVNLEVLSRWLPDPADLLDKLQILSSIYHETHAFADDNSEFNNTMLAFQDWVLNAEECLQQDGGESIKQLPEQWRHAHASTALSVRSLQRQLSQLPVPAESSLATLMKACSGLLDATLRELDMMSKLETTLLEMDRRRIESAIAASGCQDRLISLPEAAVLCWQEAG